MDIEDRYEYPELAAPICKRCGANVGDPARHDDFHAKLNQMWGAAGLPILVTEV
jgi:hypothetical protein